MPSLFSRSRTASTPKKPTADANLFDEFGRITSRGSAKAAKATLSPTKKDKKKDIKEKGRARTISSPVPPEPVEFTVPDGFLTLNLNPQRDPADEIPQERRQHFDYGYLSCERHVILGLKEVARLVDVVGDELGTRGLTTPFIFSTLALDVSASAVRRLIHAFLKTCQTSGQEAEHMWRQEARLAGPHELGMCLRWGLARVVRMVGGHELRGLVSYESYLEWSDAEAAMKYPATHFGAFIAPLEPVLQSLLVGLLTLLTRFTAHSVSSGHTPPTLSPLFGPLLFGLGPSTLAFHHVYVYYLRAAIATEHLMLAFIRWQDAPSAGLGVPTRLKEWIKGYPAMLPVIHKNQRPQPRRGARTVRVVSVRRNVRMYSPDLVKTAASWGQRSHGATSPTGNRSFAGSKEWERIAPPTLKLAPRYSDNYRKRMDLQPNVHPEMGAGTSSSMLSPPSLSASVSTASTTSSVFGEKELGVLGGVKGEDRFKSLTDLKWGEFEAVGFGSLGGDDKKLQFDLTEGARAARAAKRSTLSWQDFSAAGFSRNDAPLSATLQFSPPVANSINAWPSQSAELHRKLKKAAKALPPFGWDTEPVIGSEEVIEEAFIDVFCDLVYGGGWMDAERWEETDRECNWALVEFKSLPLSRTNTVSGTADPRTSSTLILFEEFVPLEYRQQLAAVDTGRRRLPSIFSNSSRKQWKQAPTLNGRPYVVGHVPHSPSFREVEFEGLLRSNGSGTKILSLTTQDTKQPALIRVASPASLNVPAPLSQRIPTPQSFLRSNPEARSDSPFRRPSSRQNETPSPGAMSPTSKRASRFRLPVSPSSGRTAGLPPAEYSSVDFEARLASFDDDDLGGASNSRHGRRMSKDDAWVDILVANNNRRIGGQEAELRPRGLKGGRSDPELASQEVSEVLAAVRGQLLSDDEDEAMEAVRNDGSHQYEHEYPTGTESEVDRETVSVTTDTHHSMGEEVEEVEYVPSTTKRRLGYFDLHPDRLPAGRDPDDEPLGLARSRVSEAPTLDNGDTGFERPSYEDDPRARFERPSLDSQQNSSLEDAHDVSTPQTPKPTVPQKDFQKGKFESLPSLTSVRHIAEELRGSSPIPSIDVSPPPKENKGGTQSKTASLIEMYRERERGSTSPATAIPPSRLPVRASSLPAPTQAAERSASPSLTPAPAQAPTSARSPSPTPAPEDVDDDVVDPKHPSFDDLNSASRYVHGAPLHNVLEEEEEE